MNARILIVGAGPTGVTLACLLLKHGIPCRIIDKRTEQTKESKAINVSAASMQMFDRMGIAPRFLANGKKVKHVYGHWENKRLIHINYNLIDAPYTFFLSMPQAKSERIISDYLLELGIQIERNIEFVESSVEEEHVEVVLRHANGQIEKNQYDYLIACDGAKSSVRNQLGVSFVGHDYHQHYHLLDGFVDWQGPSEDTHYYVTEKGYFIIAPMVGGYHRIVLFDESKGTNSCTKEDYQRLIDMFGPGKVQLKEVLWCSKGFFYNRLIDNFRYKKRIFFAGDAAHVFSPLGGHGMNTCLQDVDNLAWKLAGVINYSWPDRILDTYDEERKVIAKRLVTATDFSTRLINKIEKEFTTNIVNWFPLLRNRENIRKRYPYQFSGLAQQYNLSEFVYAQNSETENEKLVGRYLPYAGNLKKGDETLNTYQLSKLIPVILLFGRYDNTFISAVKPYGFPIYNIVSEATDQLYTNNLKNRNFNKAGASDLQQRSVAEAGHVHDTWPMEAAAKMEVPAKLKTDSSSCLCIDSSDPLFIQLIDKDNALKNKCNIEEGNFLILRPDGMVGFRGHQSDSETIKQYLEKWFTPQTVFA